MTTPIVRYKNHHFQPSVIAHAVWLYFRFRLTACVWSRSCCWSAASLSPMERSGDGVRKFGPAYAKQLRRRRPSLRDIWHLDEVVISIPGRKHWLWRAVDQDGYVLDEIVQSRRDTIAARRLLCRLLKKQGLPSRLSGSSPTSCAPGAAKRQVLPDVSRSKGLEQWRGEFASALAKARGGDATLSISRGLAAVH